VRRVARALAIVLLVAAAVAAAMIPAVRATALRGAGHVLAAADQPAAADLLTMDVESGFAGVLKLADLYRAQPATVALMVTRPTAIDEALARRGVRLPHLVRDALVQLGVPRDVMVEMPAGEGGTTETTAALAAWARTHPAKRVLVVVGPSHGRRYRRALLRAWPDGEPTPRVVTTPYALFNGDDWWRSRTTLREGLVELEKLLLDYVAHPL
jgi:uncharacterized SAM-binding protein YcdF (DUF218 family)